MEKEVSVFDIEADGLQATRIHCLSAKVGGRLVSTANYGNIAKYVSHKDRVIVGHNIIRYDIPTIERIIGCKVEAKCVDTLILSWYLFPERPRHGLADWGEYFGVPKPPVEDWENQPLHVYIHRCEEDVKINTLLWEKIWGYLLELYGSEEEAWRLIDYLMFKMDCAREQERVRWKLDVVRCEDVLAKLQKEKQEAYKNLIASMPKVPVKTKKSRPAKPFKQDGSMSVTGERWFALLKEHNLPDWWNKEVEVITGWKEPNPGSHEQIKAWLYEMGWKPMTFKYVKRKEEDIEAEYQAGNRRPERYRPIEQIYLPNSGGSLCPSVKELMEEKEPNLKWLEGVSVISHRITILEGFLKEVDGEGYVQAQIQGLTNTMRFKHKVVVNLPGVDKPYGKDVRGVLVAPEGYELCGSDMCSLEDRTKQHYMYPYDPEYVKEMMTPDFDPHIDICVQGGLMSIEDAISYKNADEGFKTTKLYKALGGVRKKGKATNYACVYGAGGPTVARSAGISESEGKDLVEIYWKRNWSVKAVAEAQEVKVVHGQKWLFNPVSRLWYSLRAEKDRFSTLNQGTGVYCFDTWTGFCRHGGLVMCGQMHDEWISLVRKGQRDQVIKIAKDAVQKVNKLLKLNRDLDCDVQFGDSYSDIH
jgi:hypothetical protein